MTDREKVIRGLECCLSPNDHENCPYDGIGKTYSDCLKRLASDALALLKEQEARVMTLEEVEEYSVPEKEYEYSEKPPLYVEYNHDRPIYIKWLTVEWLSGRLKDDGMLDYNRDNNYGWRCWTAWPTDEQRRTVKWDD